MDGFSPAFQVATWQRAMRYAEYLAREHAAFSPSYKPAVMKLRRPAVLPWLAGWVPRNPKAGR